MKKYYLTLLTIVFLPLFVLGQGNFVLNKKQDKIPFQLINNLIIFPVEVNGVELSFLLDTGISKTIIFNSKELKNTVQTNNVERTLLRGLGEGGMIESLKSKNNNFKIGNAVNNNQDLYAVFDERLNFTPRLGVAIHGIIGYDFLKDFIVEVNYSNKFIRIYNHETYYVKRCNDCEELEIKLHKNKPYVQGEISLNGKDIPVNLLIDSGGSDALWLFENKKEDIEILSLNHFDDFLGFGLSGSIYGKRSKINSFELGKFKLSNVNVAFPNSASIHNGQIIQGRNGSVSGEVLKRFNIIINYKDGVVFFKKNRYFSNPFSYNKSGITIEQALIENTLKEDVYSNEYGKKVFNKTVINVSGRKQSNLDSIFIVVEVRENSPAYEAGLKFGDIILSINGKSVSELTLQKLNNIFYDEEGKRIGMVINREGKRKTISFNLKNVLN